MKRSDSKVESQPGEKEVKQAYGALPKSNVPPELDAKVLARARAAADKTNKVVTLQRALRRWAVPLSTAASVIVVMSVVYEMRFSTPRNTATLDMNSPAPMATEPLAEEQAAPADSAPPAAKPATRNKQRAAAGQIAPTPVVVGPGNSPVMVTLPESPPIVPPPDLIMPSPPASAVMQAPSESVIASNELHREKKEQEVRAADSAKFASGQLAGSAARRADAMADAEASAKPPATLSLATLAPLVGRYTYESYRIVALSGEILGMKQLGYTTATLDIDTQGVLTRRMTLTDGKVVTQTAQMIEVKLNGQAGNWTVLWSDVAYPVEASIEFDGKRLTSRTQFEHLSDSARFGNVELATLRRVGQ